MRLFQSFSNGIMGRRFPDGGLLRYRKWVPQQLGDVADRQPTNGSAAQRHGSQSHRFAVRVWSNLCICSPGLVELVKSNLAPDFPLFHVPKALFKMASGLISPSGHHGQLCIVTESFLLKAPLTRKCVNVVDCYMPNILIAKVILFVLVPAVESSTPPIPRPIYSLRCWFQRLFANTPVGQCQEEQDSPPHDVLYHQHYWWASNFLF